MNPKIGQTEEGFSYIGGDPSLPDSWKEVGSVDEGYKFKGGDPSQKESWEEVKEDISSPKYSNLDVLAGGIAQGGTLGLADQFMGGIKAVGEKIGLADKKRSVFDEDSLTSEYAAQRDAYKRRQEEIKESNPSLYTGAEIGGALATSAIPGMQATKLGRIGRGALEGATYGLAESEADLTKGEYGEALKDTAFGGGLGLGGGVLGEAVSAVGGKLTRGGKETERQQALKEIGMLKGEGKKIAKSKGLKYVQEDLPDTLTDNIDLRNMDERKLDILSKEIPDMPLPKKIMKELAEDRIHKPIIRMFSNASEELDRVHKIKEKAVQNMNKIADTIDSANASTFNPKELAERIEQKIGDAYLNEPLYSSLSKQYQDAIATITKRGDKPISFKEAQELKNLLSDFAYKDGKQLEGKDVVRSIIGELNDYWEESLTKSVSALPKKAIDEFTGINIPQETLDDFLKSKVMYGRMKDIERSLTDKIVKESSNLSPDFMRSLAFYAAGGAAAGGILGGDTNSSTMGAIALPLLRGYASRYGAQTMIKGAQGAQALGKGVRMGGEVLKTARPAIIQQTSQAVSDTPKNDFSDSFDKIQGTPYQKLFDNLDDHTRAVRMNVLYNNDQKFREMIRKEDGLE